MRVVVHIGLGKTGTSTIQVALNEQRAALAAAGICVPGTSHVDTRRAVYDLMGRRIGGTDRAEQARLEGAWGRLVAEIAASPAPTAVVSEEMLALARPAAVRRLVADLAPRRLEIVVTLRDLGRVAGSYWQQMVVMGRTEPLGDFLAAVRDPRTGPASAGVGFWLRQDVVRSLDAWETQVDRAAVSLVTVPPPGSPAHLLEDRFGETLGAPPGLLRGRPGAGNVGLGRTETEVVRRLNQRLGPDYPENRRLNLMRILRNGLAERPVEPIVVPPEAFDWIEERAADDVRVLRERGYRVVGSLDDLAPRRTTGTAPPPTEAQVADAAVDALAAVARDQGRLWVKRRRALTRRRARRAARAGVAPETTPGSWRSRLRAASFGLRTRALHRADESRVLGWAARVYLRRTSRR